MKHLQIRVAREKDHQEIARLLKAVNLPLDDLGNHLQHFWVAEQSGRVVGGVGLEIYPGGALLRSLAVAPSWQGKGVGDKLYNAIIDSAREQGIQNIYLLTETAESFFARRGFTVVSREKVPESVRSSVEFQSACPASAVCMYLPLKTAG